MFYNYEMKRYAFSLIELLVVVAIIASLAALAIPIYTRYSAEAKIAAVISVMDGIKKQLLIYYSQNGTWPSSLYGANYSQVSTSLAPHTVAFFYGTHNAYAWIGMQFDSSVPFAVAGCGQGGWIFQLMQNNTNGTFSTACGQWTTGCGYNFGNTNLLPAGCNSSPIACSGC